MLHKEGLVSAYQDRVDKMLNDKFSRYFVGVMMLQLWNHGPEVEVEKEEDLDE